MRREAQKGAMRLSQIKEAKPSKRRKAATSKRPFAGVAAHKAFIPIVTIWGAALFGLIMVVLPQGMIDKLGTLSGGLVAGLVARIVLAAAAAVIGGVLGYGVSSTLHSRAAKPAASRGVYSAYHASRTRPIDPAADLGSESLDAPLDADFSDPEEAEAGEGGQAYNGAPRGETLGELAQRGYDIEGPEDEAPKANALFTHGQYKQALIECCEGASCEAAAVDESSKSPLVEKPERSTQSDKPRELDLAEFAELPGRNAVWVVEEGAKAPAAKPKPVPASALDKLRERPTDELSLVEMVERFAGALHQHQESERERQSGHAPGRDAALAEALKALTMFTESGFDTQAAAPAKPGDQLGQTERDLRDALAKLQTLRGAA
ncbi:hypothetical protein [Erythrobacter sp. NAP1]|uniref:hypothetical protein n=1 Tax=Erythrobacter sp. NAP1 TaxID=237727 RepID=UPI0012EA3C09|nr:hypothetical protein [Erythrobacter sp. NAP1]